MSDAPPALAPRPQFTSEYWSKVPRQTSVVHIARVTNLEDGWVEIVMKEGMRLRRERKDIQQLLAPNVEVHVETIHQELVTGLFVPGVGWAFRMTAEDLAKYTIELSVEIHTRRQQARDAMVTQVSTALTSQLEDFGVTLTDPAQAIKLALAAISVLEAGPQK